MIELNRNLESTVRMIHGKLDMLGQMMMDDSCVEVESVNIPNEVGTVPIIALCEGFDDAAKACGATVSTDKSGVKFFMTTDGEAIFLKQKNKTSVGPVCTCEACGNYNPRYGNHCDALRIAFDDSEKCWARMSREKRMDIETAMAATASDRHCDILDRKMTYWARHPIEEENEEK